MYIPLYIKTEYSLLMSLIKVKDLVKRAKELNLSALAITDNNLYGVYEFYLECIKNDIKPIIGLEVEINNAKILLYAKNNNGYKNLIKINEYDKSLELLNKYSNDLICIVPYNSMNLYNELNKIYSDIYIGYNDLKELENIKEKAIYLNETLYLDKRDKIYYLYLKGIKENLTISDINVKEDNSLIKYEDNELYKYIYDNCNVKLEKRDDLLPVYKVPDGYTEFTYLKEMVRIGLKNKFGEKVNKIYIDRIKHELEIIKQMGFCNYFLVVMDYVKYAKDNNILVGPGRGSAAGSLVSYALDITEVDPIKYNLLFERFLNPDRITMPDIDIDFEFNRREEVINYCKNKYGEKKVASIVTFGTLASRQALRDVSKVMDLDQKSVDSFVKLIDSKLDLKHNLENQKIKDLINNNKELKELYEISLKLEGLKRHTSVHAAGIIISNIDLDEVIPIVKHNDMCLAGFTMNYLEQLGLLKMDFLALKNLTLITNTIEYIRKDNINIEFNKIPLNDKKAFDIFKDGNTVGIFQFESEGMKNFLKKLKPDNIEDLAVALALYRPGPMGNIDSYIRRKQGKEKIDYLDDRLKEVLESTYGIIIYQEQIMKISNIMASYTLAEADNLRRAMSKKKADILLKEKDKFINGSINNGYSKEVATKVYNLILKFSEYGFNRSHAVSYSLISYKMAYLKANYNKYFMKCLLDNVISTSSTKEYIYEARLNNLKILKPDINLSTNTYEVEKEGLRFPLIGIKNVGYNAVIKILEERKISKFKDIFDFVKRTYSKQVNKETIISLINAGCFDSFNINHRTLVENIDIIINYADLAKDVDDLEKPSLQQYKEYSRKESLTISLDIFGFYLNDHPLITYKAKNKDIVSIKDVKTYFNKRISIVLIIDKIKEIDTKKNEKMCFITGSDELDSIDVVVFPDLLKENSFNIGDILVIYGKIEKRFDKYQMIANAIKKLTI